MSTIPEELGYTEEHEWISAADEQTVVRVGITDFAQQELGDVVFVQLPDAGTAISQGEAVGEIESTKSVSEVFAPLDGEIVARNEALEDDPALVNSDPYGEGWLFDLRLDDPQAVDQLLDAAGYRQQVG